MSAAGIICRTSSRSLAGIIGAAGADGTPPSALNPNHHYAYHDPEHSRLPSSVARRRRFLWRGRAKRACASSRLQAAGRNFTGKSPCAARPACNDPRARSMLGGLLPRSSRLPPPCWASARPSSTLTCSSDALRPCGLLRPEQGLARRCSQAARDTSSQPSRAGYNTSNGVVEAAGVRSYTRARPPVSCAPPWAL